MKFKVVRVRSAARTRDLLWLDSVVFNQPSEDSLTDEEIFKGYWWVVYDGYGMPVAYCGLGHRGTSGLKGDLLKCGVRHAWRGLGLQRRLLRVREAYARRLGMARLITYTAWDNIPSNNNLISAGYRMWRPGGFQPEKVRWLYWYKDL